MNDTTAQQANKIELEIRETQDQIGETVQKLEEQLAPRQVVRSVIGDDRIDWIEGAIEVAKRNPVPVAMIAIGALWLLSKSGPDGSTLLSQLRGSQTVEPRPVASVII